jgi:histidine ammonia-lyase
METPRAVNLDGGDLTMPLLDAIFGHCIQLRVRESVRERIRSGRRRLERLLHLDQPVYGVNTGLASLCNIRIPEGQLNLLQENLLRSHAVGLGDPVPDEIVRFMLLFKAQSLAYGNSGIRLETFEALVRLLNEDLLPLVPSKGSLGASGDLAPFAHLSLPLIGLGYIRRNGVPAPASDVLTQHGWKPLSLEAKEGLSLINGTQFMTAYGAAICVRAWRACKVADIVAAMALQAIEGTLAPFDARLHALRPHPGAIAVAKNISALMAGRPETKSKRNGGRVQDPYSIRCVPQVHGAARDAIAHAQEVILRDVNAVTDNPVILDDGEVISGGNFHGEPVALALDYLACALAELASISERRQYLLINNGFNDLPIGLIADSGVNSGLLIAQYTSASLVAENKILCHPASVDSIPTAGGQEDHVSMGATAAVKCWQIMDNLEHVLAIELVTAAQALDFTPSDRHAPAIRAIHEGIRHEIPHADSDRVFSDDFAKALTLALSQQLVRAAERITPAGLT